MNILKTFINNSSLHFIIIGGIIFLLFNDSKGREVANIKSLQLQSSMLSLQRQLGVEKLSATYQEDAYRRVLDDEILYLEALKLGMDKDDHVVRQRLIQKMLILSEQLSAQHVPSEKELQEFYHKTRTNPGTNNNQYKSTYTLQHIYYQKNHKTAAIAALNKFQKNGAVLTQGDSFTLPLRFKAITADKLQQQFGDNFLTSVETAPVNQWIGPVASKYGWHLINLQSVKDIIYDEYNLEQTLKDYQTANRHSAYRKMMLNLYQKYNVKLPQDSTKELQQIFTRIITSAGSST